MAKKTNITLLNFFIFNSSFGPKEGEEEKKILFYYPPATDIDTKIKNVGLCEAISKFTQTFTEKPCQALHTQRTRQIFFEAEPEYIMVMTLSIPYSQKVRDSQNITEYHEDDVQDTVYEAIIQQAYKMFRLFNGLYGDILTKLELHGLKQRLEHFFSKYLLTLKLNQSDVTDIFNGIHFLPLDKNTYLRIQCFINLLEASYDKIRYTAFLYNDQLVWSGLEQENMRILYTYLITSLFPAHMEQELHGTPPGGVSGAMAPRTHYGKFILGPPNMADDKNLGKIPVVHVTGDHSIEEYYLLVYRALSATVVILLQGNAPLNFEYLRKIDKFLGPHMSSLASDIGEQYARRPTSAGEPQFRYVYFNHMNLAQKSTVHTDSKKTVSPSITAETLKILADLNHDLNSVTAVEDGETIVKTCTDCWVVGKKSDQREFYVLLNQKNANLIEINEEVKRLCASQFNNIFFLD